MVSFNEATHTYTNASGEKYISVTTLLNKYKPPFDAHYWSTYKAMKAVLESKGEWNDYKKKCGGWDKVVEFVRYVDTKFPYREEVKKVKHEILKSWNENKKYAADKGTAFHKKKEDEANQKGYEYNGTLYPILGSKPLETPDYTVYGMFSELLLYNHEFKLAGQADVVVQAGRCINIFDYKTSKSIDKEAFQDQKLLYPVDNLPNANYYLYALQLSIYAFMMELKGYDIGRLQIEHIDRESHEVIALYPVDYYKKEAELLIKHYCEERDKSKGTTYRPSAGSEEDSLISLEAR